MHDFSTNYFSATINYGKTITHVDLFVSFEVNLSDKKSITKITDNEKCMKELEDDDTKIVNSTINRKSGELHLYFHNDKKIYRLHLTDNEGTCLVYKK